VKKKSERESKRGRIVGFDASLFKKTTKRWYRERGREREIYIYIYIYI